jgi:uncharacterized protein (TIRG00374 family)
MTAVPAVPAGPVPQRAWLAWLTGILLLGLLALIVSRRDEELRFADLLRNIRPGWLLLAVLLQVGTYACSAATWHRVLAWQQIRTSFWRLLPLGPAKLFMDQMVPSAGLSGLLLVVKGLERRGVPDGPSVSAVVVGLLSFYLSNGIALLLALAFLALSGDLSRRLLGLALLAALILGGMVAAVLWLSRGKRGRVRDWLMRVPRLRGFLQELRAAPKEALHDHRLLATTTAWQCGIFLFDTATLTVCLAALGASATLTALFAALVIASLVATITLIPSGLGTFDATMLVMLGLAGVTTTQAVGALLLFRGFTLLLPLVPGLWLARREMKAVA